MKFRFCGDADCPDWVLEEINTLSRLSSVKIKLLGQVVAQGIIEPPIDMTKAEQLFADSKLDIDVDLKACIACLTFIITSTARFGCDHSALQSELQQLGLPREHSTSIKRVTDDYSTKLAAKFASTSLQVNELQEVTASYDVDRKCAVLQLTVNNVEQTLTLTPFTLNKLLESMNEIKPVIHDLSV